MLVVGWLYGGAFLLLTGAMLYFDDWPSVTRHAGGYLLAELLVGLLVPVAGLFIAAVLRGGRWLLRFGAALCAVLVVWGLVQLRPESEQPFEPGGRGCSVHSGGSNTCSGG